MTLRFAAVNGHWFYVEFRSIKAIQYLPLKLQTPTAHQADHGSRLQGSHLRTNNAKGPKNSADNIFA